MYEISRECYDMLGGSSRKFTARAAITLADGSVLQLGAGDFKQGGISLDEATSQSGSFDLGAAIIGKLTLTLNNMSGKFSAVNFIGGQVSVVQVGVYLDDGAVEWIPLGIFDIDSVKFSGSAAEITAYDMLGRADRDLPESIVYPVTLKNLLSAICIECGIPWNNDDFLNADYVVNSPPQKATCREIISYIAQLAGCYARITRGGELELNWYGCNTPLWDAESWLDGGVFIEMSSGDIADGGDFFDYSDAYLQGGDFSNRGLCIIHSPKSVTGGELLTITGVKYIKADSEETAVDDEGNEIVTDIQGAMYLYGTDEYTFDLSENPLIQHDIEEILAKVGEKLQGDTFNPLSVSCTSNPALEAGDIVRVTDRRGNVYTSYINACTYKYGSPQTLSCDAESAAENQSVSYNAVSRLERKINSTVNEKINDYNRRVQTLNNLMLNSMGVYKTAVQNSDGSVTYYTHDKPALEESSYISCESSNGFAYTNNGWNNGSPNWQYGTTKDGNMLCNVLATVGIVADWIKAGRIESEDGSCYFDLDNNQLFANKIGLPTRYLSAGEITSDSSESRAGIACFDENLSDSAYFQVRPILSSADAALYGFGVFDAQNRGQIICASQNNSSVALYGYNGSEKHELIVASAPNGGVKISSMNGRNMILVTDNGISIYKDGTVVQSY